MSNRVSIYSIFKKVVPLILLPLSYSCNGGDENHGVIDYVNVFVGTDAHGHTWPGASAPFGAVQLSPDTRTEGWDACSGYHYEDTSISGFSHTHLSGTGCADLGDFLFKPFDGEENFLPYSFKHEDERAFPGYYSVNFPNEKIRVELTASERCGIHKYSFQNGASAGIIIDLKSSIGNNNVKYSYLRKISDTEIEGARVVDGWLENRHVYFFARFSSPFKSLELLNSDEPVKFEEKAEGTNLKAVLKFGSKKEIEVRVGISSVSAENAKENLISETGSKSFDEILHETSEKWKNELEKISVVSGDKDKLKIFYTALYHCCLVPNVLNDVNGEYRCSDGGKGRIESPKRQYSTLSVWDIYRAWSPLMTILNPQVINDIVGSALRFYKETGELPIWTLSSGDTKTMIGYHMASIMSDACMKGIVTENMEEILEAMIKSSDINSKGSDYYIKNGYIPSEKKNESVSCTVEYSYDDWCIAVLADYLGKKDIAEKYFERACNWHKVFDGKTKFFRGKKTDGNFISPFERYIPGRDYTEANAWQYRFAPVHDIGGLIREFSSEKAFSSALDSMYVLNSSLVGNSLADVTGLIGMYAHGNEPSHHVPFLYNYTGENWKTQERVREILETMYSPRPDGICGNEDCGQMSAWYVLASLGLYQTCPGSGEYLLTSPLFEKASVRLPSGKTFVVTANDPDKNKYISKIFLNGKQLDRCFIKYEEIMAGGNLNFVLDSSPDKATSYKRPYSLSGNDKTPKPYAEGCTDLFDDETYVTLKSDSDDVEIRYTTDGKDPDISSELYVSPLKFNKTTHLKAMAFGKHTLPSQVFDVTVTKADYIPATDVKNVANGIIAKYYEGFFENTGRLSANTPKKIYVTDCADISSAEAKDHFGYEFSGYIYVEEKGKYVFELTSDDGSVLFLDGKKIVDNDGSHAKISASGTVCLEKGYHDFVIRYFEDYEGEFFGWRWKKINDHDFKKIDKSILYHKK